MFAEETIGDAMLEIKKVENKRLITLIVGSDSLIGSALMTCLKRTGEQVVGTTRRRQAVNESHIYLDLSKDLSSWNCPLSIEVAVICAAVTKLDECKHNPQASKLVNVDGISALVKSLTAKGTFVIFLSTNMVFDGSVPCCLPDEPVSPKTVYGQQKTEIERQLCQLGDLVTIVRFTKILGAKIPLFISWSEALINGKTIHPFSDMFMAPLPLSYVISVLRLLIDTRLPGIFQVSADRDISYAEVARLSAHFLDVGKHLVQPILASQSDICLEHISRYTTMDTSRLKSTFGLEPPNVNWTIKTAFTNPALFSGVCL